MMNTNRRIRVAPLLSAATLALLLAAAGPAAAQQSGKQQTKARSGQQGQCVGGGTWQDRQTCLKEAAAARQAAQRNGLVTGNDEVFMKNRLARCQALPPADRDACSARMAHPTEVSGSVTEGGVLYQYAETAPLGGATGSGAAGQRMPAERDTMQRSAPQQRRGATTTPPPRTMPQQPRMN